MIAIKLIRTLLLLTVLSLPQLLFAQNIEFKSSNFKSDRKGLKVAQNNIKIADEFRENVLLNILSMQDAFVEAENACLF